MGKINRVGERFVNNQGCSFFIVEYINAKDVWVQFENGVKMHTQYICCKKGEVLNPYHKSQCGVGYIGLMGDNSRPKTNGREYILWRNMIKRCYDENSQKSSYKDVTVCERWHCFANFLEDIKLIDGYELWLKNPKTMALDKDIKQQNVENKVYSLQTCTFITVSENTKERNVRHGLPHSKRRVVVKGQHSKTGEIIVGNLSDIAESLNLDKSNIVKCCKNKDKKCGGYHWQYVDDTDE